MNDHGSQAIACSLSFLAGALAGATAGVLLAPRSGRETRERIDRGVRESTDKARRVKDRLMRRGEAALSAAARKTRAAREALSPEERDEAPLGETIGTAPRAAEELS
jgi:gas vesicle protein